jgi:hypothetical protein
LAYAVHVHYSDQASSALETYIRLPPKQQERIAWIFVPLKGLPAERKIEALWLRYREISNGLPEWTLPSLVVIFPNPFSSSRLTIIRSEQEKAEITLLAYTVTKHRLFTSSLLKI